MKLAFTWPSGFKSDEAGGAGRKIHGLRCRRRRSSNRRARLRAGKRLHRGACGKRCGGAGIEVESLGFGLHRGRRQPKRFPAGFQIVRKRRNDSARRSHRPGGAVSRARSGRAGSQGLTKP